jgi:ketosteroid isomerase-like protein
MRLYIFALALIVLLLAACQPVVAPASAASEMTEEEAFRALVLEVDEALAAGDVDRLAEFMADDFVNLPPGSPATTTKEEAVAGYRALFDAYDLDRHFTLLDVEVAGDYGTRYGEWTQTLTPKAGGDPIEETGRCIVGFKKFDGEWKEVWAIWNTY